MRTDTELQTYVLSELRRDTSINTAQVGVQAKGGVVTISGEVASLPEKLDLERHLKRIQGVHDWVFGVNVVLPDTSQRCDAELANTADTALQRMSFAAINPIKVLVEDGWVTLSGNVDWEYQRRAALAAVRPLIGVRGVSDRFFV